MASVGRSVAECEREVACSLEASGLKEQIGDIEALMRRPAWRPPFVGDKEEISAIPSDLQSDPTREDSDIVAGGATSEKGTPNNENGDVVNRS